MKKYQKKTLEEFLNQKFDNKGNELWLNGDLDFWKNVCELYFSDNIDEKSPYISWKTFAMNMINQSFQEINVKENSKLTGATIFISDSTTEKQTVDYAVNQLSISASELKKNYDLDYQIHISYPISQNDNNFISINYTKKKKTTRKAPAKKSPTKKAPTKKAPAKKLIIEEEEEPEEEKSEEKTEEEKSEEEKESQEKSEEEKESEEKETEEKPVEKLVEEKPVEEKPVEEKPEENDKEDVEEKENKKGSVKVVRKFGKKSYPKLGNKIQI